MLGSVKLVSWWLALGSGTSGGTLAPILLISASFGTLVGTGLNHVLPGPDVSPGAFALVAMAATFGASTRATFTAIVFVFELTRDYQVVIPVMIATVLADLVFNAISEHSIMTEKLGRRGLRVGRHYGVDPFDDGQRSPHHDVARHHVARVRHRCRCARAIPSRGSRRLSGRGRRRSGDRHRHAWRRAR